MHTVGSMSPTGATSRKRSRSSRRPRASSAHLQASIDVRGGFGSPVTLTAEPLPVPSPRSVAPGRNLTPEQRIGHAAVRGTLVGYAAVTAVVSIIGLISHAGIGPSIGIALVCAFWGGPGFGGMIGATLGLTREQEREDAARRPPPAACS